MAADGQRVGGLNRLLKGASITLDSDSVVIPTPGHTRDTWSPLSEQALTGDHLAWSPSRKT